MCLIINTSMGCKLCGERFIFLSSACIAPIAKQQSKPGVALCYSSTNRSKEPSCRINKQGDVAEIRPVVVLSLLFAQTLFTLAKGAQLSFGNVAQPVFNA